MSEAERRTEELSAFLDGELESGRAAELQQRLDGDPELRAELETLRRTVQAVQGLPSEAAPAELRERLSAALAAEAAAPKRGRVVGLGGWVAGISAVAASLLIAALLFNGTRDEEPVREDWEYGPQEPHLQARENEAKQDAKTAFKRTQDEGRARATREQLEGETRADEMRPGAFRGPNSGVAPGLRTPGDDEPPPPKPPVEKAVEPSRGVPAAGRRAVEDAREEAAKPAKELDKQVKPRALEAETRSRAQPDEDEAADAAGKASLRALLLEKENQLRARGATVAGAKVADNEARADFARKSADYLSILAASPDREQILASLKATAGAEAPALSYAFQDAADVFTFKVGSAEQARQLETVLMTLSTVGDEYADVQLGGLLERQAGKKAAPDEAKAPAPDTKKREKIDRLTGAHEELVTSVGGVSHVTRMLEVRLPPADAALVGRWGARFFPSAPPAPEPAAGERSKGALGEPAEADADDLDQEEAEAEEDAGDATLGKSRKKAAPPTAPGAGSGGGGAAGAPAPPGSKAAAASSTKNERDARRVRLIRIRIVYEEPRQPRKPK